MLISKETSVRRCSHLVLAAALACLPGAGPVVAQQSAILGKDARYHIGKDGMVCDRVDKVRFAQNSEGSPTFLYMGGQFPRHLFSVRVPGAERDKFNPALDALEGRDICAIGRIERDSSRAMIEVTSPANLKLATFK